MSSTIFINHRVYKMDLGISDGNSIFVDDTVVVVSDYCEQNCYPHTYKTIIEFIGSVDRFSNSYIPRTAYYFDDGLSKSPMIKNGTAFKGLMNKLFSEASPLTVNSLHAMGFFGYSWSDADVGYISDQAKLTCFTHWLGTRYGARISTDADIHMMISQAYEIVNQDTNNIWMSRLWKIDRYDVEKLEQAEGMIRV